MKNKYLDLIEQTFDFPQEEFSVDNGRLIYKGVDLMPLIEKHGTPLRFAHLPTITEQIKKCRSWFSKAFTEHDYQGNYLYSYCTKSSHFVFIVEECLKNNTGIETSSAFDLDIILSLYHKGSLKKNISIICNGFKDLAYIEKINDLVNLGFTNIMPVLDNFKEFELLDEIIDKPINVGIRIASEEEPTFEFYTSRLGIGYSNVLDFYKKKIKDNEKISLKMLHFFVNSGIRDNAYYWSELAKFINVYSNLISNDCAITSLNIGGGFPVKNSLGFEFDYEYMIAEIVSQIQIGADNVGAKHPDIYTEFGSFTVAESGGMIFSVEYQKKQNDREKWNMIDGSFMTALPDSWAINKRFLMLPVNRWNEEYERVFLGGMTCDSDDYYNSEQHVNAIYLPKFDKKSPLYVCFFNCGAYQESISGYGGLKHCLIPAPKFIILSEDSQGNIVDTIFRDEQKPDEMLKILGY